MDYAFVTGMGRSGTTLVSRLLACDRDACVMHEYIGNREFWLLSWYLPAEDYTGVYLTMEKEKIEKQFSKKIFIDVNGRLQCAVPFLYKIFNARKVFHLVRNPLHVIPSIYSRRNDQDVHAIPKNKEGIKRWLNEDKFYQVCWNWSNTTRILLNENTELILFEKILTDYHYCQTKIFEPLSLHITEAQWKGIVSVRVNKTRSKLYRWIYARIKGKKYIADSLPPPSEWTDRQKQIYHELCVPVALDCGYAINSLWPQS